MYVGDASGNPVNDVVLRYETVDGAHSARSYPTGKPGTNEPGWTDFTVSNIKQVATWRVWVVDDSDNALSAKVDVTTTDDCSPGVGHQVAEVRFRKN